MNWWFILILLYFCLLLGLKLGESNKEGSHIFWGGLIVYSISLFIIYMAVKTGF